MSALNNLNNNNSIQPVYKGWTKEEICEEAVQQLLIKKFTEIVSSYEERKKEVVTGSEIGPWYGNDYALKLKEHQTALWEKLINENIFFHGRPPQGFYQNKSSDSPTGIIPTPYIMQSDCPPTTALNNIKNGPFSFLDCGSSMQIAIYDSLHEIFGDQKFNTIFSEAPLILDPIITETPLSALRLVKEVSRNSIDSLQLGDQVYFANIPLNSNKHPHGHGGYRALCISSSNEDEKKFIAFGLSSQGVTYFEINELLLTEFNAKPIDMSMIFSKEITQLYSPSMEQQEKEYKKLTGKALSEHTVNPKELKIKLHSRVYRLDTKEITSRL